MKKKLIAVVGPTASGKTALAIEIAKKLAGEWILVLQSQRLLNSAEYPII